VWNAEHAAPALFRSAQKLAQEKLEVSVGCAILSRRSGLSCKRFKRRFKKCH
jgi:hypothetical protein